MTKFCFACGRAISADAALCVYCGRAQPLVTMPGAEPLKGPPHALHEEHSAQGSPFERLEPVEERVEKSNWGNEKGSSWGEGARRGTTLSNEERNWGMACHAAALLGYPTVALGFIIGPLVVWLVYRDRYRFVDDQGKESINFHITMLIAVLGCFLLFCAGIGPFLLMLLPIYHVVMIIIAMVHSSQGQLYRYPLTIRLLT
jgi:hypothetical protein